MRKEKNCSSVVASEQVQTMCTKATRRREIVDPLITFLSLSLALTLSFFTRHHARTFSIRIYLFMVFNARAFTT